MRFNIWRKWLQQTIQNIRRGRRSLRKRFVRGFKPLLGTLEDRVTPSTYTPTTTSDLTFTTVDSNTGVDHRWHGAMAHVTLRSAFMAADAHAGPTSSIFRQEPTRLRSRVPRQSSPSNDRS